MELTYEKFLDEERSLLVTVNLLEWKPDGDSIAIWLMLHCFIVFVFGICLVCCPLIFNTLMCLHECIAYFHL